MSLDEADTLAAIVRVPAEDIDAAVEQNIASESTNALRDMPSENEADIDNDKSDAMGLDTTSNDDDVQE
jgi:hypothetical protein